MHTEIAIAKEFEAVVQVVRAGCWMNGGTPSRHLRIKRLSAMKSKFNQEPAFKVASSLRPVRKGAIARQSKSG